MVRGHQSPLCLRMWLGQDCGTLALNAHRFDLPNEKDVLHVHLSGELTLLERKKKNVPSRLSSVPCGTHHICPCRLPVSICFTASSPATASLLLYCWRTLRRSFDSTVPPRLNFLFVPGLNVGKPLTHEQRVAPESHRPPQRRPRVTQPTATCPSMSSLPCFSIVSGVARSTRRCSGA